MEIWYPAYYYVLMTTTPTRFAVTVDEHMLVKYTRYKYYDMPQGMELPFEWNEWDADTRRREFTAKVSEDDISLTITVEDVVVE